MILNYDQLSSDLKRSKKHLIKHVNYLEQAFLIRIVKNYRTSALSSSRKLKKIYPYHPCFSYNKEESKIMENAFASILNAKYYWRDKEKEVDFICESTPVEVKYRENISSDDSLYVKYFMKKFAQKNGVIITKNNEDNSHDIKLIPYWKAALTNAIK